MQGGGAGQPCVIGRLCTGVIKNHALGTTDDVMVALSVLCSWRDTDFRCK